MNRTQKFAVNTFWALVYQGVVLIAGFITPKIMLTQYGSELNGLISSITQFIVYFNLLEAGLSASITYSLYKPLTDQNTSKINAIVSAAKHFYTVVGWMFAVLTFGLAIIYPFFIKTSMLSPVLVGILIAVLGASGILDFFSMAKYRTLFVADQKNYMVSLASCASLILTTVIICVCGYFRVNIVVMRTISIFPIVVRSLILFLFAKKRYPYLNFKVAPDNSALSKRWDALFLEVLGVMRNTMPSILLTIFSSLKNISIYQIFNMVMGALSSLFGVFVNALPSSFGNIIAQKEQKTLQKVYQEFEFLYYMSISWAYSVSFVMIMPFIRLYTSNVVDANYDLPLVGFLMVLDGFLYNLKTPQGMLIISAGMYRETRFRTLAQLLIMVILGVVLVPYCGIVGVVLASSFSNLYRDIDLLFFVPRRITQLPVRYTLFRQLQALFCLFVVVASASIFQLPSQSALGWVVSAFLVGIYAAVVILSVGFLFNKKQLYSVWARLKSMKA